MTEQLEELLHLTRTLAAESPCDHLRLVTISRAGEVRMLEATDDVPFRKELYKLLYADFTALGLLGFEESEDKIQAKSYLFPWHEDDPQSGRYV